MSEMYRENWINRFIPETGDTISEGGCGKPKGKMTEEDGLGRAADQFMLYSKDPETGEFKPTGVTPKNNAAALQILIDFVDSQNLDTANLYVFSTGSQTMLPYAEGIAAAKENVTTGHVE